ncbi:MAG: hypothetical protein GX159_12365 [Flavobacteriaceae bacterium]|nr:hypothetical protein [Flavobacteriaceae bacterium]
MKKIVIIIFISFFITTCSNGKISHKKQSFLDFKNVVSKEVFTKFPITDSLVDLSISQKIIYPEAMYASGYCGLFIEYEYKEKEYKKIYQNLKERSVFTSQIYDSCNLNIPLLNNSKSVDCYNYSFPVPNINDKFNDLDELTEEKGTFLNFSTKNGIFINDHKLLINNVNGYSNGAIVDYKANHIIYWVIIW